MLNITINQAINFWNQLVKCYYNNNPYGGDSTEIYTYDDAAFSILRQQP